MGRAKALPVAAVVHRTCYDGFRQRFDRSNKVLGLAAIAAGFMRGARFEPAPTATAPRFETRDRKLRRPTNAKPHLRSRAAISLRQ